MDIPQEFFQPTEVESRSVLLGDEREYPVHIRPFPDHLYRSYTDATREHWQSPVWDEAAAKLISAALCEPDGSTAITIEQAKRLKMQVKMSFVRTISESVVATAKKPPPEGPTSISGESLPSPSGAEALPSGSL